MLERTPDRGSLRLRFVAGAVFVFVCLFCLCYSDLTVLDVHEVLALRREREQLRLM